MKFLAFSYMSIFQRHWLLNTSILSFWCEIQKKRFTSSCFWFISGHNPKTAHKSAANIRPPWAKWHVCWSRHGRRMDNPISYAIFEVKMDSICWDEDKGESQSCCFKKCIGCRGWKGILSCGFSSLRRCNTLKCWVNSRKFISHYQCCLII